MMEEIWVAILIVALALIAVFSFHTRKKGRKITINKTMFAVGLIIALVDALMMFCQERCFLGVDLEFWPMVLGIIGIGLIATSNFFPLKGRKK